MLMDGSGINPSVDYAVATQLLDVCIELNQCTSLLDFGTGMGWLVKRAIDIGIDAHGLEGSSQVVSNGVSNNIHCVNICSDDMFMNRKFDISTSFECIEHIPREHQHAYWRSVKRHSDKHFCSIHVKNQESDFHSTIVNPSIWESWFNSVGIKYKRIIHPNLPKTFYCSVFYMLDVTEYNDDVTKQLPTWSPCVDVINNWE